MKTCAFLLRGAISKYAGTDLLSNQPYVNYQSCYLSILKHIIQVNPEYQFDFYIHCWNEDLQDSLIELYHPKAYCFEFNMKYEQVMKENVKNYPHNYESYPQLSQSLSIQKVIELMELSQLIYDKVIIYRTDTLIWKDMILSKYDHDKIYVNAWNGSAQADFHFVMNYQNALFFKGLYDSAWNGNVPRIHIWIKHFINTFLKLHLYEDEIIAGVHQEVVRILFLTSYPKGYITEKQMNEFGLQLSEIQTYFQHLRRTC